MTVAPTDQAAICAHIAAVTGEPCNPGPPRQVGGGCINETFILGNGDRAYFVKTNRAALWSMFEAEAAGLSALAGTRTLRVPAPICAGRTGSISYLAMERLALGGPTRGHAAGRLLAALHRTQGPHFGWERDNFIGATPQPNTPTLDWTGFWREHRLGFQLALAERNGFGRSLQPTGDRLLADLDGLLGHGPAPSLLHGDLWGGNLGYLRDGSPAVFDPAAYYGDREAELAMTELFGGFPPDFYAAYREAWPLDPGYRVRRDLYSLYHILNHLNLFGAGYLPQARRLIGRLLAELG